MKQSILTITFLIVTVFSFSQNIKTNKYEVYLNTIIANEVNIAKSMYMTSKKQYFYEGEIEANIIDSNETNLYSFYFTAWDEQYKEFLVKDENYNVIDPEISFNDKETAILSSGGEYKLRDTSSVDYAILSSMLVWLENKFGTSNDTPTSKTIEEPVDNNTNEPVKILPVETDEKPTISKDTIKEKKIEIRLIEEKE